VGVCGRKEEWERVDAGIYGLVWWREERVSPMTGGSKCTASNSGAWVGWVDGWRGARTRGAVDRSHLSAFRFTPAHPSPPYFSEQIP
jgi:hypothetical protein